MTRSASSRPCAGGRRISAERASTRMSCPAALRTALSGTAFFALGGGETADDHLVAHRRADRTRADDPPGTRQGALEQGDQPGALRHRADRQVPPEQHLPQARRLEPRRSRRLRAPARAGARGPLILRAKLRRVSGAPRRASRWCREPRRVLRAKERRTVVPSPGRPSTADTRLRPAAPRSTMPSRPMLPRRAAAGNVCSMSKPHPSSSTEASTVASPTRTPISI